MANQSIYNAFERMWQHIVTALGNKANVVHNHDDLYDAKGAATTAESNAKTYTDSVISTTKDELLNGAGEAYDTLHELGDLIDNNTDAIDALEIVATSKASVDDLSSHVSNTSNPHNVTTNQLGLSSETWTITLVDGTVVTKNVVVM